MPSCCLTSEFFTLQVSTLQPKIISLFGMLFSSSPHIFLSHYTVYLIKLITAIFTPLLCVLNQNHLNLEHIRLNQHLSIDSISLANIECIFVNVWHLWQHVHVLAAAPLKACLTRLVCLSFCNCVIGWQSPYREREQSFLYFLFWATH